MTTPLRPTAPAARPGGPPPPPQPFDPDHPAWAPLAALMQRLGGQLLPSPQGPEFRLDGASTPSGVPSGAICPLPDYGLLTAVGADAGTFLQNQLTNDLLALGQDEARWTGYCTPKGRLLTTALNWSMADGFALAVSRGQADMLARRLSMYVLRAKARITNASANWLAFGLIGEAIAPALAALGLATPADAMSVTRGEGAPAATAIGLPSIEGDNGSRTLSRVMLWVPLVDDDGHARSDLIDALVRSMPALHDTALWRWTEVRAAIPRLFTGSAELFVPQMINFEAVGGVNFKKGCYPGQEIVARSQYLGKLKRRMYLGHLATDASALPAPGQDVMPASGGEPSGQVVLSAPRPGGGVDVLFESQISAVDDAGVRINDTDVQTLSLPYALPQR